MGLWNVCYYFPHLTFVDSFLGNFRTSNNRCQFRQLRITAELSLWIFRKINARNWKPQLSSADPWFAKEFTGLSNQIMQWPLQENVQFLASDRKRQKEDVIGRIIITWCKKCRRTKNCSLWPHHKHVQSSSSEKGEDWLRGPCDVWNPIPNVAHKAVCKFCWTPSLHSPPFVSYGEVGDAP